VAIAFFGGKPAARRNQVAGHGATRRSKATCYLERAPTAIPDPCGGCPSGSSANDTSDYTSMPTLDDTLLEAFMNHFYGYGRYQAAYWLVGMEEGGGRSLEAVARRLAAWDKRGRQELEDVADYHRELGLSALFRERPTIQPTWGKLIRILLAANGQVPTPNQIRAYQRDSLGRSAGDTCLLELLPLPSPSTDHWLYGRHSQLPYLANRAGYQAALLNKRLAHLQQRLNEYRPSVVLFYSFRYRPYWQQLAGVHFDPAERECSMAGAGRGSPLFVLTQHPATPGLGNDYFHRVGQAIAAKLAEARPPVS
jgi:hypothetical protein